MSVVSVLICVGRFISHQKSPNVLLELDSCDLHLEDSKVASLCTTAPGEKTLLWYQEYLPMSILPLHVYRFCMCVA